MFLFVFSFVYFVFDIIKKKIEKSEKIQKQCVFSVPWMAIETKFSKLCIFCSLDEYLNAQLSK